MFHLNVTASQNSAKLQASIHICRLYYVYVGVTVLSFFPCMFYSFTAALALRVLVNGCIDETFAWVLNAYNKIQSRCQNSLLPQIFSMFTYAMLPLNYNLRNWQGWNVQSFKSIKVMLVLGQLRKRLQLWCKACRGTGFGHMCVLCPNVLCPRLPLFMEDNTGNNNCSCFMWACGEGIQNLVPVLISCTTKKQI